MKNDFMVADMMIRDVAFTEITVAAFEDSGWYKVDYDYAISTTWAKNEGCDFFLKKCIEDNEPTSDLFCADYFGNKETCDFSHINKSY